MENIDAFVEAVRASLFLRLLKTIPDRWHLKFGEIVFAFPSYSVRLSMTRQSYSPIWI
jgi:hypothetical protein